MVKLENIKLNKLKSNEVQKLSNNFSVLPFNVPHRSEFTDTIGFIIKGPTKKVLFIPDIDSWEKMIEKIEDLIESVDYAFLDGTFYDKNEILNRNVEEIPHPFIIDSIKRFENFNEKSKIYFIHLNHTNPCLKKENKERKYVESLGFKFVDDFDEFEL